MDVIMQSGQTWFEFGPPFARQSVPVEAGLLLRYGAASQWCPDSKWMIAPDSTSDQLRLIERATGHLFTLDLRHVHVTAVTVEPDHFTIRDWEAPCAA